MLVCSKEKIDQIRTLITSIEFELTPPSRDALKFTPDRQDIMLKLMHIREATKAIEIQMLKDFPIL